MKDVIAYLNGRYLPLSEARLPVWDYAVVQGATVTDMVRTFQGEPFRLEQHLERFAASRRALGIQLPESNAAIATVVREIAEQMRPLLRPESDFGILMFATPGEYRTYAGFAASRSRTGSSQEPNGATDAGTDSNEDAVVTADGITPVSASESRPTLCIHPFPLSFAKFHYWYQNGVALAVPQVRQIPAATLPPSIKYRSRLHWYLADRQAREIDRTASALLLDEHGCVTETNSGNLFIVREGQLLSPRVETTLPGVSQAYVSELARAAGMTLVRADLTPDYVLTAEEAFVTSTTYCIAPVTWLDGAPIAEARPGPVFRDVMARWSQAVNVDILQQAERMGAG